MDDARTSENFRATDADVTFRSYDGVLFNIHRKNLEINAGGFPPGEVVTSSGEIVPLTEASRTLELLFRFVYPRTYPDLKFVDFEDLALLAEAAEKYNVYPAMAICEIHMRNALLQHVPEVFGYALKHGYCDLAAQAAPLAVGLLSADVIIHLPQHAIIPWCRYQDAWETLRRHITRSPFQCCVSSKQAVFSILTRLGSCRAGSLMNLDALFGAPPSSTCCRTHLGYWRCYIEAEIAKIPEFKC